MALELLSGPHPIVDIRTGANVDMDGAVWVDPVGLIAPAAAGHTYLVQMDGSAFHYADSFGPRVFGLCLMNGTIENPLVGDRRYSTTVFDATDSSDEWLLDRVSLIGVQLLGSEAPGDFLAAFAHLQDRYISPSGDRVNYTANGADGSHIECTIAGLSGANTLSWAREPGRVWIGTTTGLIVQYDFVNKVASSPVYRLGIVATRGVFYSAKHDVFISVRYNAGVNETHVWGRRPLPNSIAAPTADRTVQAGRAVTLTTRVMGADSDPCANEVVAWSVIGEGTLERAATYTDADGYATNRLVVALDVAGPDLQVTVAVVTP